MLPFDPTSTTPVMLVALNSKYEIPKMEEVLYDVGRCMNAQHGSMQNAGATAPVVIGGKVRAVMLYLDLTKIRRSSSRRRR